MQKFSSFIIVLVLLSLAVACNKKTNPIPPGGDSTITEPPAAPDTSVKIGAYYFDGWYDGSHHVTDPLRNNEYPERTPIWGWVTSTQDVVKTQIDLAADAGLNFFSFCWFYNPADLSDNKGANGATKLFRAAPNKNRMKFCLMVANHSGYYLTPAIWTAVKKYWLDAFRDSSYLKVEGKPVIIFFEYAQMQTNFGGMQPLKDTLANFRKDVAGLGFKGAWVGVCSWPGKTDITNATAAGFDFLTGYNWASAGRTGQVTPVANLAKVEYDSLWNKYRGNPVPLLPVSTLNFDKRPWSSAPETEKIYTGFGEKSVLTSVSNLKKWIDENPASRMPGKLGILYAWNEYGEGGWLTPSLAFKDSLLTGLRQALK